MHTKEQAEQYLQEIMNDAYKKWQNKLNWGKRDFWAALTEREKIVVFTGNLNYQVCNGGFLQWHDNGYSGCADSLCFYLDQIGTETSLFVKQIVIDAIRVIEYYEDNSYEDEDYLVEDLEIYDNQYYDEGFTEQLLIDVYNYVKEME